MGLNLNSANKAANPRLISFNGKLYLAWHERIDQSSYRVRVKVYNGDDMAPGWKSVDKSPNDGLNKTPSGSAGGLELMVFNNKLYASWPEGILNDAKVRVAVYNGDDVAPDWKYVDGHDNGITKQLIYKNGNMRLAVADSKLYALWLERTEPYDPNVRRIRMAVYNGSDQAPAWQMVDGANGNLRRDPNAIATNPEAVTLGDQLFLAWSEQVVGLPNVSQIRMARYNGDDTAPERIMVDGDQSAGLNKDPNEPAFRPRFVIFQNNLYGAWWELNAGGVSQIRVMVGE